MFLDVWEHKGLRLFYAIINLENIMLQAWGKDTFTERQMSVFISIFCLIKSLNFTVDSIVTLRSGNGWICLHQEHFGM